MSSLYPGLTESERRFIDANPKVAIEAYWMSWKAEKICNSVFAVSDTNDESDACRHFMWACLLNNKLGQKTASEILDAHEQNPNEPQQEKAMDMANNRRGIIASDVLIKAKKTKELDFLNQFKQDLKDGKLIVLRGRKK